MTAIARRETLLDFWGAYYLAVEKPSTVAVAIANLVELGFDRGEVDRAREKALELHLYDGDLPGCDVGIPPGFMHRFPRGRGAPNA